MTPAYLALILGGAGLIVGHLLGFFSARLARQEGVVGSRSRDGCDRSVARRRLISLAGVGIGVWAALSQTAPLSAGLTALLGWQLLLIAVIDAEHFWLPDRLTLPLLVSGLLVALLLERPVLFDAALGVAVGFIALWLIGRLYKQVRGREGLGGGDPILLAAGGAWVGWIGLPSVLLWASTAALSLVLALRLSGRRVASDDRLPFGVFLALGIWLTWLLGPLGLPR